MYDEQDAEYCAKTALRYDPERHLTALLAGREARLTMMSLIAWNGELGQIGPRVREPMAGALRLAWWRETIKGERPPEGPLARSLLRASLPVDDLLAIVDGRMRDFDLRPFADIAELEGYAQAIGGRLGGLLMRALGEQGEAEQAAAYGIGVAWALVGLLRSALQLAREGRSVLPGLEAEEVLANDQVAREVSRKVSERAKIHLNNSRLQIKRAYRPALLLAVPARDFLHILQRNDYNLADQRLHLIKRSAPLRMLLAAWLGKI